MTDAPLPDDDLRALADIAERAAAAAAAFITSRRPERVEHKPGGHSAASQVVTEIDRGAEALILEHLAPTLEAHDIGVLTEERVDDGSRLRKRAFWSVDPLDGTLPYVEGEPGFAVSIGLVSRAGAPLLGVVTVPSDEVTYRAIRGLGAHRNGEPFVSHDSAAATRLAYFIDRGFLDHPQRAHIEAGLHEVAVELGLEGVDVHIGAGSVANACRVTDHGPACSFKLKKPQAGGGSLWDFAACASVVTEAGAVATDAFGAALDLNRPDSTFMNHRGVLFASGDLVARALLSRTARWSSVDPG